MGRWGPWGSWTPAGAGAGEGRAGAGPEQSRRGGRPSGGPVEGAKVRRGEGWERRAPRLWLLF